MITRPVKERIPDLETALRCISALIKVHPFSHEEELFEEDCYYSLKYLKKECTP